MLAAPDFDHLRRPFYFFPEVEGLKLLRFHSFAFIRLAAFGDKSHQVLVSELSEGLLPEFDLFHLFEEYLFIFVLPGRNPEEHFVAENS